MPDVFTLIALIAIAIIGAIIIPDRRRNPPDYTPDDLAQDGDIHPARIAARFRDTTIAETPAFHPPRYRR